MLFRSVLGMHSPNPASVMGIDIEKFLDWPLSFSMFALYNHLQCHYATRIVALCKANLPVCIYNFSSPHDGALLGRPRGTTILFLAPQEPGSSLGQGGNFHLQI